MTATAFGALAIILVGALLRHLRVLRDDDGQVLVRVVIYAALPALVFLIIVRAHLTPSLLLVPVAGYVIHGVMLGAVLGLCRVLGLDRPTTGAFLIATAVGNTGFFGLPLVAASGDEFSQPAALMYDALCTGVLTWTSTVAIATAFGPRGGGGARIEPSALVSGLLLPPMWALAAGLVWNLTLGHDVPDAIEKPLDILAGAVLPLVMLCAGAMFDFARVRRAWRLVALASVVRLGLGPAVGLGVGLAFGFDDVLLHTVVIMSAMPTAMMSLVLGAREGLDTDLLAGAVVITTLLCTLTLPLLRMVIA